MPEPVNNVVGSSRGTRFDLVIFEWPRAEKKARYSWRRSAACMFPSYKGFFCPSRNSVSFEAKLPTGWHLNGIRLDLSGPEEKPGHQEPEFSDSEWEEVD